MTCTGIGPVGGGANIGSLNIELYNQNCIKVCMTLASRIEKNSSLPLLEYYLALRLDDYCIMGIQPLGRSLDF